MKVKRAYIKWKIEKCQEYLDKKHPGAKCLDAVYINNNTKMNIKCRDGHIWNPCWSDIQSGHWCPHCVGTAKPTLEYILSYLNEHHPGSIWSNPTEYKNAWTKLHIICKHGHNFRAAWANIQLTHWCPDCAGLAKPTSKYIISYLEKYHPGSIWHDLTEYKNNKIKLTITCKYGHIFTPTWNSIQNKGSWCPDCLYKHQTVCKEILEKLLSIKLDRLTGKYADVDGKKRKIYFDGYNDKYKIVFEYNGEQHYNFHHFHQSDIQKLRNQQQRDIEAWKYCLKNDITLIVIPYWIEDNKLERYIKDQLIKASLYGELNIKDIIYD